MNQPSLSGSSRIKRALKIGSVIVACAATATIAAFLQAKHQGQKSNRAARVEAGLKQNEMMHGKDCTWSGAPSDSKVVP